jgi:hypothetical protein
MALSLAFILIDAGRASEEVSGEGFGIESLMTLAEICSDINISRELCAKHKAVK